MTVFSKTGNIAAGCPVLRKLPVGLLSAPGVGHVVCIIFSLVFGQSVESSKSSWCKSMHKKPVSSTIFQHTDLPPSSLGVFRIFGGISVAEKVAWNEQSIWPFKHQNHRWLRQGTRGNRPSTPHLSRGLEINLELFELCQTSLGRWKQLFSGGRVYLATPLLRIGFHLTDVKMKLPSILAEASNRLASIWLVLSISAWRSFTCHHNKHMKVKIDIKLGLVVGTRSVLTICLPFPNMFPSTKPLERHCCKEMEVFRSIFARLRDLSCSTARSPVFENRAISCAASASCLLSQKVACWISSSHI